MNSIDEQIRKALTEEDQKAIDEIDIEAGVFEMIGLTLKGKQAWLTYFLYFGGIVTLIGGIYSLSQYIAATDIKTSMSWSLAIIACMLAITLIKLASLQQMAKLELMREIKRLEMRILLVVGKNKELD